MIKKINIVILITLVTLLVSCNKNNIEIEKISGEYILEKAELDGLDITTEYYFYNLNIKDDYTMNVSVNYLGLIENRQSNFSINGNKIIEKFNDEKYEFVFDETNDKLKYEGDSNGQKLVINFVRKLDEDVSDEIDFESILFGEDISDTKIFNYAPAIIIDKDKNGNEIMHIWYCTNKQSGIIMDHIGYRTARKTETGKWVFSEEQIVLEPTVNTWDGRHVCDPTVIKGEFNYQNETYNYMMSYLGCETDDYSNNETGIAIANNPEGPWIKMDHINPIVPWNHDNNPNGSWGTGMPILMSVDQKGKVLLYYSSSSIGVGVQYWDLTNLDEPEKIFTSTMNNNGAKNPNGTNLGLAIADFAYDFDNERLYIVTRTATKNPPDITMTRVDSHAMLAYIDGITSMDVLLEKLERRDYIWNVVDYVGPEDTGFERNHNVGLVKDSYGRVYQDDEIWAVVSTGRNSWPNENIFTYRLLGYIFNLD